MAGKRASARFRSRGIVTLTACIVAAGCSGGTATRVATLDDLQVPECDEYARRMASCLDREELVTTVPTRARDEAQRDRMRASCAQSLDRITTACP